MNKLVAVLVILSVIALPTTAEAAYYPSSGHLYYNGNWYAESIMRWSSPGPWSTSQPGYEHDLMVSDTYFESCTSYSGLPNGYDDWPTAGYGDPQYKRIFSFGAFDADLIQANQNYWGYWEFSGGSAQQSQYNLYGQEVYHQFCPGDSIWCMGSVSGHTRQLRSGTMNWNQAFTHYW